MEKNEITEIINKFIEKLNKNDFQDKERIKMKISHLEKQALHYFEIQDYTY